MTSPGSAPEFFPEHVADALVPGISVLEERIGDSVMVVVKRPPDAPTTLITAGASRIPVRDGTPIELAIEVALDQIGAGVAALRLVCGDLADRGSAPPLETPWRNDRPVLTGTRIRAVAVVPSRHGPSFEEVRAHGRVLGHVRTLQFLTWAEADVLQASGWEGLLEAAGGREALLDVERDDAACLPVSALDSRPITLSRLHETSPPRWVDVQPDGMLTSVTGQESPEYMAEAANHTIWSAGRFVATFPWTERFVTTAAPGESAFFPDDSGTFERQ